MKIFIPILKEPSDAVSPESVIAGVPLVRRLAKIAERAGVAKFDLIYEGTFLPEKEGGGQRLTDTLIICPNVLMTEKYLRDFLQRTCRGFLYIISAQGIFRLNGEDILLPSPYQKSYREWVDQLLLGKTFSQTLIKGDAVIRIQNQSELKKGERWLLKNLIKENEGFMSRRVERKISLSLTQALMNKAVTPNFMTWVSLLTGVVGALFFLVPSQIYAICGALLFWLHSVLDGCDGEIARLKYQESYAGGVLDFFGDNIVHSAVFICLALGLYRETQMIYPVFLGMSAFFSVVLTAGWVFCKTMSDRKKSGPVFTSVSGVGEDNANAELKKIADTLARRDFIYLVIFLALLNRVHLFLWMGAIGTPIYFLTLLYINKSQNKARIPLGDLT